MSQWIRIKMFSLSGDVTDELTAGAQTAAGGSKVNKVRGGVATALQHVDPSFNPYVHVGQIKLNTLCRGIKEAVKVALWDGRLHFCSLESESKKLLEVRLSGRQAVNKRL